MSAVLVQEQEDMHEFNDWGTIAGALVVLYLMGRAVLNFLDRRGILKAKIAVKAQDNDLSVIDRLMVRIARVEDESKTTQTRLDAQEAETRECQVRYARLEAEHSGTLEENRRLTEENRELTKHNRALAVEMQELRRSMA